MTNVIATDDSDDLEALFDSIVATNVAENERSEFRASEAQRPNERSEFRASEAQRPNERSEFRASEAQRPNERSEFRASEAQRPNEPKASFEERPTQPVTAPPANGATAGNEPDQAKVINQIGQMARTLHDALRELGLNKEIEKAASTIPDARDRLNYVATLTQQAAERVLNATEAAQPVVEKMETQSRRLSGQWQMLFDKKLDVEQFKSLATQTHAFLDEVPKQAKATNAFLVEIMMAQDFQDLTGQVIKKIIEVTRDMEQQLLALLVENAAPSLKAELNSGLLNGPVINSKGRTDVVTSQDQVDDLLESLGF